THAVRGRFFGTVDARRNQPRSTRLASTDVQLPRRWLPDMVTQHTDIGHADHVVVSSGDVDDDDRLYAHHHRTEPASQCAWHGRVSTKHHPDRDRPVLDTLCHVAGL